MYNSDSFSFDKILDHTSHCNFIYNENCKKEITS